MSPSVAGTGSTERCSTCKVTGVKLAGGCPKPGGILEHQLPPATACASSPAPAGCVWAWATTAMSVAFSAPAASAATTQAARQHLRNGEVSASTASFIGVSPLFPRPPRMLDPGYCGSPTANRSLPAVAKKRESENEKRIFFAISPKGACKALPPRDRAAVRPALSWCRDLLTRFIRRRRIATVPSHRERRSSPRRCAGWLLWGNFPAAVAGNG